MSRYDHKCSRDVYVQKRTAAFTSTEGMVASDIFCSLSNFESCSYLPVLQNGCYVSIFETRLCRTTGGICTETGNRQISDCIVKGLVLGLRVALRTTRGPSVLFSVHSNSY